LQKKDFVSDFWKVVDWKFVGKTGSFLNKFDFLPFEKYFNSVLSGSNCIAQVPCFDLKKNWKRNYKILDWKVFQ
jgi:hypothetical protein